MAAVEEEAQLVVTELATNVIKHVGQGVSATLVLEPMDGRIRVEVHDTSSTEPVLKWALCDDECGRGLHLLAGLTADWGVEISATGKAVWCELILGQGPECLRLQRAAAVFEAYHAVSGASAPVRVRRTAVTDESATQLIADVLHWLAVSGADPDTILDRAQMQYEAEAA